jgi:hypothetical protein
VNHQSARRTDQQVPDLIAKKDHGAAAPVVG